MEPSGDSPAVHTPPAAARLESVAPRSGVRMPRALAGILRSPLVQFLAIGTLLFAVYTWRNPDATRASQTRKIAITQDDVSQAVLSFRAQWQREPMPSELRGLLEQRVREEVLYREALSLGLDQNDTIVRRRLAQKMQFLSEDVANLREPSPAELEEWYSKNAGRFALPPRITFRHLYFSSDLRGGKARDAALAAFRTIGAGAPESPLPSGTADRFMFNDYYSDRTPDEVAKIFGSEFATAVFQLRPGAWEGPVQSGYGWHVVYVQSITPGREPAFEEVAALVKAEWLSVQRDLLRDSAYKAMRDRYEVSPPPADSRVRDVPGAP